MGNKEVPQMHEFEATVDYFFKHPPGDCPMAEEKICIIPMSFTAKSNNSKKEAKGFTKTLAETARITCDHCGHPYTLLK